MAGLEEKERLLNARFLDAKEASPVLIHPNLAEAYRRRVAELERLLEDPELRDEAMEAIRSMIERIIVTLRRVGSVDLELYSDLVCLVAIRSERKKPVSL